MAATIAGCSGEDVPDGQVDHVTGFIGLIAAEEPRSALIARDTLSAGGSAADAAVAMALAQTVTYQGRVGLAGGGVCVVYDAASKKAEALDFRAVAPQRESVGEGVGTVAGQPGMVRGLYALQARYGRLRWGVLVAPAEQLARFGNTVSRAFAGDLALLQGRVADGDLAALYDGVGEGGRVEQLDLAASLALVRLKGPGALYGGPLGRRYVEGVQAAGMRLSLDDVRAYQPTWSAPATLAVGNEDVYTADSAAGARVAFAHYRRLAGTGDGGGSQDPGQGQARLQRASATTGDGAADGDPAAVSGFVVVDRQGQAVSCALSMNGAFGAGRLAGDTGMLIAKPSTARGDSALAPVVAANRYIHKPYLAAAISGEGAAAALARLLFAYYAQGAPLAQALAGDETATLVAAACRNGIPSSDLRCTAGVDPRASGLSIP